MKAFLFDRPPMFGKFFDTSAINALASGVAQELLKALPPAQCEGESKASLKRREQAHERVRRHVDGHAAVRSLNVYQKSKLGLRLQDALETAGYPAGFAKQFSYDVVRQVAMKASAR